MTKNIYALATYDTLINLLEDAGLIVRTTPKRALRDGSGGSYTILRVRRPNVGSEHRILCIIEQTGDIVTFHQNTDPRLSSDVDIAIVRTSE